MRAGAAAMAELLAGFAAQGVPEPQARSYLPDWWQDAAAATPAGLGEARRYIKRGLRRAGQAEASVTTRTFETSGPSPDHGPCLCPHDASLRETTCTPCGVADCPKQSPSHYAGDRCEACGWVRVLICDVCGDEDAPQGERVCTGCAPRLAAETEPPEPEPADAN